jgi:hypothetical protein
MRTRIPEHQAVLLVGVQNLTVDVCAEVLVDSKIPFVVIGNRRLSPFARRYTADEQARRHPELDEAMLNRSVAPDPFHSARGATVANSKASRRRRMRSVTPWSAAVPRAHGIAHSTDDRTVYFWPIYFFCPAFVDPDFPISRAESPPVAILSNELFAFYTMLGKLFFFSYPLQRHSRQYL